VATPVSGLDRAQVQAEAVRANNSMHPTEVLESQVQAPVASSNLPASNSGE
jgi:hypothetical protein